LDVGVLLSGVVSVLPVDFSVAPLGFLSYSKMPVSVGADVGGGGLAPLMRFENLEAYEAFGKARIREIGDAIRRAFLVCTLSSDMGGDARALLQAFANQFYVCIVGRERVFTGSATIERWLDEVRGWELFIDDDLDEVATTAASA
jgi:hypothetical protein